MSEGIAHAAFYIAVVVLVIFCAGEPDLLDAIVQRMMVCK